MSADKTFTCKAVSRLKPSTMYMTGSAVKELGRQVDKGRSTAKLYKCIFSALYKGELKQNQKSTAYLKSGCAWLAQVLFIVSPILILSISHLA